MEEADGMLQGELTSVWVSDEEVVGKEEEGRNCKEVGSVCEAEEK